MREGVILIATSAPTGEHYRQLISRRWEEIDRNRVFTTWHSPAQYQGLRVKRVYMTPEAVHETSREVIDMLIRSMAFDTEREGFFVIQEDGDIYGGFDNIASGETSGPSEAV